MTSEDKNKWCAGQSHIRHLLGFSVIFFSCFGLLQGVKLVIIPQTLIKRLGMHIIKFIVVFSILFVSQPMLSMAQNKVVIVPMEGESTSQADTVFMPIVLPSATASPYLEDAIDKPIIWNKGWDTTIGNKTQIDPTVTISFSRISPAPFGSYNAIYYTPGPEIRHWGEQTNFPSSKKIYSKSVLLVDKGAAVEGGPFEWTLNKQNFVSLGNIFTTNFVSHPQAWIRTWDNPRSGEKVWFFLMSDDERFSSNPITFIWP